MNMIVMSIPFIHMHVAFVVNVPSDKDYAQI